MRLAKKTVKDVDLNGKTVLLRADYNVPLDNGKIGEPYRIEQNIPTIQYLLKQNSRIVICSHLGRPGGKIDKQYSLKPVANFLSHRLKRPIKFVDESVGEDRDKMIKQLQNQDIVLLENLRFDAREEGNDQNFAKQLAAGIDVFVQDGFGVVHRAHTSTDAITKLLPSVAGLLLEREYETITQTIDKPKRPLVAIVGGAKIEDKIDVLKSFIKQADFVAVGGAMANTFLDARGVEVGKSLVDEDEMDTAQEIMELADKESKKRPFTFYLPQDVVVADAIDSKAKTRIVDWDAHVISDIESYPKPAPTHTRKLDKDEMILDIGPFTGAFIAGVTQFAETVIWNGLMGVTEVASKNGPVGPFAHGTELMLDSLMGQTGHKPFSLIGGGDTSAYVEQRGLVECFNHVSTGGGAALDLIAGKKLPGVEALSNK